MSGSTLSLYQPINALKPVADNIWIIDGPIVTMDMGLMQIPFPTRMTIVRLENDQLWCHSPIALTPALKTKVDGLGKVAHVVSPNKIHYAHIQDWVEAYPDAIAWASPGVRLRAAQQNIAVTFHDDLTDAAPSGWSATIDQHIFRGSRYIDEVVFFHKPSQALILTDLIENFEFSKVHSLWFKSLLRLAGNADPDGKTPLDLQLTFWGNKTEARQSLSQLLQWNPEKIILAHGLWYEKEGRAELERAFRWLM